PAAEAVALVRRDVVLADGLLLLLGAAALGGVEARTVEIRHALEPLLQQAPFPVLVAHASAVELQRLLPGVSCVSIAAGVPGLAERAALWRRFLEREGIKAEPDGIEQAAAKFRLPAGRIASAAATARDLSVLSGAGDVVRSGD